MCPNHISELDSTVSSEQLTELGLEVTNIVCTVNLGREFDLNKLSDDLPHSEYNPETTAFLLYRPKLDYKVTIMIPFSGNISMVGASNINEVIEAFGKLKDSLSNLGINVQCETKDVVIQNVVLTGDFKREFDLNLLAVGIGLEQTEYEPEQFPGLIFRSQEQAVLLLFKSGAFVVTGVSTYHEAVHSINTLVKKLNELGIDKIERFSIPK